MMRNQLLEILEPFGFTFKDYDNCVSLEHPLCEDFYFTFYKDKPLPTLLEIMEDFYYSAKRDESNGHRCW